MRGRIRSSLAALAAATTLLVLMPTASHAQTTTRTACPGSFQVLHNDKIGPLRLPAGAYQITVANPASLTCDKASLDLTEFLEDYDGRLRRPWTVNSRNSTFQRGTDAQTSFSVARIGTASNPGPSVNNPTSNACPGFFDVLHNDHVGLLAVPKGAYRITIVQGTTRNCAAAARLLTGFLQDFNGRLPRPWSVNATTATFDGGPRNFGFRIKPATGPEPKPSSGGRYPAKGQAGECPGTFRVLNNDRIGKLSLPAGRYLTFTYRGSGVSCAQASRLFRTFLGDQNVPSGYFVTPATGVFSKGRSTPVFRVKPASPTGQTAR